MNKERTNTANKKQRLSACTEAYKEHIMYTFNAFCRVVIRYATLNSWRDRSRKRQREISFEYLTEEKFYPFSTSNKYFIDPYEQYPITICGQTVILTNGELAAALLSLPEKKREIIYLYFFGHYTQQEIGEMYGRCRSTAWHHIHSALHILENREYTGCLVNFKTEKVSYKVKQSKENPVEKQAIFENHHEAIIDRETWERVQELRKQRKRPNRYDEVGLFSGILFCADCGSVMYQQRYQTDKRRQDCYICGSYKKRTADCTAHFIRTDLLTAGVTENLRKVTSYAAKHEARFMKLLTEQTEDGSKRRNAAKKKELEAAEKRIAELSAIFKRLYEDSVTGRISDERFTELSADYEAEQKELKEKAAALQSELSKTLEATANAEKFMKVVRKYTSFEELTPTLLREFVEKIVIHESEALDGKRRGKLRRQEIEIYYSFVGKVELPD